MNIQSTDNPVIDTEYIILENIYDYGGQQIPLRQRELAHIAGASLGMTNSILKRLAQKGWITIKKLNSRNIHYAITLEGINEIIHRSYRYFKRTIKNVVFYKEILEDVVCRAKRKNIRKVILVGTSDLDFIVEHASRRWCLSYTKITERDDPPVFPATLKIYAESISEDSASRRTPRKISPEFVPEIFYLSRLIMKQAGTTESVRNDVKV